MISYFLGLIFLISLILVTVFKYDKKTDRRENSVATDYFLLYPWMKTPVSIIKLMFKYSILTLILLTISVLIWNGIMTRYGYPRLPTFLEKHSTYNLMKINYGQYMIYGWLILLVTKDIIRCLKKKVYDFFISYKSKNVDVARKLCDQMIASGLRVWFAEYQILLKDREKFQEAIDRGIRECKYGLALTNDDYAGSIYCEKEMVQMLKYCGIDNILEIKIPKEPATHNKYGALKYTKAQIYTGDINDSIRFINERSGYNIQLFRPVDKVSKEDFFIDQCLGEKFRMNVSGWSKAFMVGGGPCYGKKLGRLELLWNLQYGEEFSPTIIEARKKMYYKNDRDVYDELIDYANHYFTDLKPGLKVTGVHLYFKNKESHFALTYYDTQFWKRRYSLIIFNNRLNRAAEFLFTFQFSGNFKEYCKYTTEMDDVVNSLEWGFEPVSGESEKREVSEIINDKGSITKKDPRRSKHLYENGLMNLHR